MNPTEQNASPVRSPRRHGLVPWRARTLDRLLRSAATVKDETASEMPFGFDTRVIALSRKNGNGPALAGLLRRVTLVAAAVIVLASAGAYFELNRNGDAIATSGN